jgi:hypothetical protein
MNDFECTISVTCKVCGWQKVRHPKTVLTMRIHLTLLNLLYDKHYAIHALEAR